MFVQIFTLQIFTISFHLEFNQNNYLKSYRPNKHLRIEQMFQVVNVKIDGDQDWQEDTHWPLMHLQSVPQLQPGNFIPKFNQLSRKKTIFYARYQKEDINLPSFLHEQALHTQDESHWQSSHIQSPPHLQPLNIRRIHQLLFLVSGIGLFTICIARTNFAHARRIAFAIGAFTVSTALATQEEDNMKVKFSICTFAAQN